MIKKKLKYEAPEAETLVVKIEGMVCQSPGAPIQNWQDDEDPLNA